MSLIFPGFQKKFPLLFTKFRPFCIVGHICHSGDFMERTLDAWTQLRLTKSKGR